MKWILHYMGRYRSRVALGMSVKFIGTIGELLLPFLLEYILDDIVPTGEVRMVIIFGVLMIITAVLVRTININANRRATAVARDCIRDLRHDLFDTTVHLTGSQFDYVTLPSLISR
ncbi:MAG: ABC transporter ATP-binding protein, partial [Lachnospiraceae bacterium]|nr:ABC transporter ATP-binding protein [Lachnospiraceae bacterium]